MPKPVETGATSILCGTPPTVARVVAILLLAISAISCVPSRETIVADSDAKRAAAVARARAALHQNQLEWRRELDNAFTTWRASVFATTCGTPSLEGIKCGILFDTYSNPAFQESFAKSNCPRNSESTAQQSCSDILVTAFLTAVRQRYALGPDEACATSGCASLQDAELKTLRAHNDKMTAERDRLLEMIKVKYSTRGDAILLKLKAELKNIHQEMVDDVQAAERTRAALRGVAAGMQTFGSSMAQSAPPSTSAVSSSAEGCSSDFQCGYGNICVKDAGALRGICATAVNQYGIKTFQPPRSDSLGPGTGQCGFDTDCPAGFRCTKTAGRLRGNCLK